MELNEQQNKVKELLDGIDKFFSEANCSAVDVLNASSIMSTTIARSLGMARKEYLANLGNMFDRAVRQAENQDDNS